MLPVWFINALLISWQTTGARWDSGFMPIGYCLSANASNTNASPDQQQQAMLNGIRAWVGTGAGGGMSCSTYTAAAENNTCNATTNPNDGQNNIYFVQQWQHGRATIGVTYTWPSSSSCGSVTNDIGQTSNMICTYGADIELNDRDYTWRTNGSSTDIESIVAHEYGHFIGLDHCDENSTCDLGRAVMASSYVGGQVRVPFADDIEGACALYPGTPGQIGWPCTANNVCQSSICVNPGTGGYCSNLCGNCPQGYACETDPNNPNQQLCLRDDGLNQNLCELCRLGWPDACANNGVCVTNLPDQEEGHCVTPCPRPTALRGGCPTHYDCFSIQLGEGNTGNYCAPRSLDCSDPTDYVSADLGETCGPDIYCNDPNGCLPLDNGLSACTQFCNGGPGQGSCPNGFACGRIGNGNFCGVPVGEGESCAGLSACAVGHCFLYRGQNTCHRDCRQDPNICNNAQSCNSYTVAGLGPVSICEPPGALPRTDAGVPLEQLDAGTSSTASDAGTSTTADAQSTADAGRGMEVLPTDCACDLTESCDEACATCDPDCLNTNDAEESSSKKSCSCHGTHQAGSANELLVVVLGLGLWFWRRAAVLRRS